MKLVMLFLLIGFTTNMSNLDEPLIKITRISSDTQIKEVEQQTLKQYGVKIEVKVFERNNKGEIINLRCVRYDKAEKPISSCSSDNFSLLIITRTGCKVADLGYEKEIVSDSTNLKHK